MNPNRTLSLALTLFAATTTMTALEPLKFLGRGYQLASHNEKANAMWEFTAGTETPQNWTTLLTLIDRPDAKSRPDLDRLAQGIMDTYKSSGGRVLMARTMSAPSGPFNYMIVAFDQPAQKRYELNFVKIALADKNAVIAVYGVRVQDPANYTDKAKQFLSQNSEPIGKALEQAAFPSLSTLPRRVF